MNKKQLKALKRSIVEAKKIMNGTKVPSRSFTFKKVDGKLVREMFVNVNGELVHQSSKVIDENRLREALLLIEPSPKNKRTLQR